MFGTVIALSLLQAAAAAPASAAPENLQGWTLANSANGCLVHTSERVGTVLSVFALPGQEGIGFILQNRKWGSLRDGTVYPLTIRFDEGADWPVPAMARTEIDEDGPGLFFAIRPGSEEDGRDFIADFADARGMQIANDGAVVDTLRLTNSRAATAALAQCLSRLWSGEANPFGNSEGARTATRI
ncbi:hypothetical protein [Allosphingosinicella sp.]|uniref:hypothetical protein n=1 Tax=Allosphingosinicella sp. TaxID=2823234 RepID=UPI002F0A606C